MVCASLTPRLGAAALAAGAAFGHARGLWRPRVVRCERQDPAHRHLKRDAARARAALGRVQRQAGDRPEPLVPRKQVGRQRATVLQGEGNGLAELLDAHGESRSAELWRRPLGCRQSTRRQPQARGGAPALSSLPGARLGQRRRRGGPERHHEGGNNEERLRRGAAVVRADRRQSAGIQPADRAGRLRLTTSVYVCRMRVPSV